MRVHGPLAKTGRQRKNWYKAKSLELHSVGARLQSQPRLSWQTFCGFPQFLQTNSGIVARSDYDQFLQNHPLPHLTLYVNSPWYWKRCSKLYGETKREKRTEGRGVDAERFYVAQKVTGITVNLIWMLDISPHLMTVQNDLEDVARPLYTNKFASTQRVLVAKREKITVRGQEEPSKMLVRHKAIRHQ
jgi:hypothetical protein